MSERETLGKGLSHKIKGLLRVQGNKKIFAFFGELSHENGTHSAFLLMASGNLSGSS